MNKQTFFVVQQREIETGKLFAYAEKVSNNYNLYGYFKPFNGCEILSVNACDTYKHAKEIAEDWNNVAYDNGKYLFQRYCPM